MNGSAWVETGFRQLANQRNRDAAVGLAVHAAAVLQPFERWRHAQSRAPIDESEFHRIADQRRAEPIFQSQSLSSSRFLEPTATLAATRCRDQRSCETDVSAAKKFSLSERLGLQFRAEIFNLFNHTNFNTPNPVVYAAATGEPSPTAGVITSTATSSRQVQFGLKLSW